MMGNGSTRGNWVKLCNFTDSLYTRELIATRLPDQTATADLPKPVAHAGPIALHAKTYIEHNDFSRIESTFGFLTSLRIEAK